MLDNKNFRGQTNIANTTTATIDCMFTEWLLDQQDRNDSVGKLARLVWDDHNAGCASMYPDPVSWKKHFEANHGKKLDVLMVMLGDAYVEYATQLNPRMASK